MNLTDTALIQHGLAAGTAPAWADWTIPQGWPRSTGAHPARA